MNRASPPPPLRILAQRLIAREPRRKKSASTRDPVVFHVCASLGPPLVTLMGKAGFRALVVRAVALAGAEIPWLRAVQADDEGSLRVLAKLQADHDPDEILEGRVAVVTHLLGLLVAFIGEKLTLRMIAEAWPKLPLNDLNLGNGDKNEKAI